MVPSPRAVRATFVCLSLNLTLCNVFTGRYYTATNFAPPATRNREGESPEATAGFVLPSSARSCDEDERTNGAKGGKPLLGGADLCALMRLDGGGGEGRTAGGGTGGSLENLRQGSYSEAALEFSKLDRVDHPEVQQHVLLGRGIANTFLGHKEKALKDLTRGTEHYPHVADFWRRRAHLLAAMGRQADALSDYSRALELEPNHPETIQERGVLAFQAGDFWTAISDLTAALKRQPKDPMLIRAVALSYGGAGQWRDAVEVMEEAVRRHPRVALLWSDKGRAHKELGQADLAVAALHKALALEESPEAYLRLGLQLQSIGDHRDAIKYAHKGLKLKPMDIELNYLEASSLHAVGDYNAAIKQYSVILSLPAQAASEYAQVQQSLAFYQRDIATYTWTKLARPFLDFQIDRDLDVNFKEAWIRRLPPTVLPRTYRPLDLPPGARSKGKSSGLPELSEGALELIARADEIGKRTQYFLDGFMPNKRQFRMAGLAALDVMQQVRPVHSRLSFPFLFPCSLATSVDHHPPSLSSLSPSTTPHSLPSSLPSYN
ncbi:unnamed protein product, partial [Closterium sp. Naga37s-1]